VREPLTRGSCLETEDLWASAWERLHPPSCCADEGVLDPLPPRLEQRASGAK